MGLRIQPSLCGHTPRFLRNWSRAPVELVPTDTLILDLNLSEEELLAAMHPKGRYNLGLSQRHGVEVSASLEQAAIFGFYDLFIETARRNRFFAEPLTFFINLSETLFPAKGAELLCARWGQQVLGTILVVYFGNRATYLYGGSSSENRHVMPNSSLGGDPQSARPGLHRIRFLRL